MTDLHAIFVTAIIAPAVDDFYMFGSMVQNPETAHDVDIAVLVTNNKKANHLNRALKQIGFEHEKQKLIGEYGEYWIEFTGKIVGTIGGTKYDFTVYSDKATFERNKWFEQNIARYIPNRDDRCAAHKAFMSREEKLLEKKRFLPRWFRGFMRDI